MAWAAELRIDDTIAAGGMSRNEEGREASRRKIFLGARASNGAQATHVLIHNLSSTGMLLETAVELGDEGGIDADIPEVGTVHASIVWSSERFYGCQFDRPLSRAAVSAAMLRSPAEGDAQELLCPHPYEALETLRSRLQGERSEGEREPGALSPRAKVLIIAGLAASAWGVVGAMVGLVALII